MNIVNDNIKNYLEITSQIKEEYEREVMSV